MRRQCKECCYKKSAEWKKKHPEINEYARTKKARERWAKQCNVSVSAIAHHGLRVARMVFDKYNRKCHHCGSSEHLAIHHINGKGRNYQEMGLKEDNKIENLELLCIRCHGSIHGKVGGKLSGIARAIKKANSQSKQG